MGDSDGDFDDAYYFYPSVMFEIIQNYLFNRETNILNFYYSLNLMDELSRKEVHM